MPTAVFPPPVLLQHRAFAPMAVLHPPLELPPSAATPTAVLLRPVVLEYRAFVPIAIF